MLHHKLLIIVVIIIIMKFKMALFKSEVPISQFVDYIGTKFHRLYPCFRDRTTRINKWQYCPMSGYVENQRWWSKTGSRYDITHISACIHDRNEIPTAIPMFSGSGYTIKLLRILPDM